MKNNSLDILHKEKVAFVGKMSVMEEQLVILETKNLDLREKLKMLSEKCDKEKNQESILPLELENNLHTTEMKMRFALERNYVLEKDLVRVKEELDKSLKQTNSSMILT